MEEAGAVRLSTSGVLVCTARVKAGQYVLT